MKQFITYQFKCNRTVNKMCIIIIFFQIFKQVTLNKIPTNKFQKPFNYKINSINLQQYSIIFQNCQTQRMKDNQVIVDLAQLDAKTPQPLMENSKLMLKIKVQHPEKPQQQKQLQKLKQKQRQEQLQKERQKQRQLQLQMKRQKQKEQQQTQSKFEESIDKIWFFNFEVDWPAFIEWMKPQLYSNYIRLPQLLGTLLLLGGIANVYTAIRFQYMERALYTIILLVAYFLYLLLTIGFSDLRPYFLNLKKFDEYSPLFKTIVNNPGYFKLSKSSLFDSCSCCSCQKCQRSNKIQPGKISSKLFPRVCQDISKGIQNIETINKFVLVRFRKKFAYKTNASFVKLNLDKNSYFQKMGLQDEKGQYKMNYMIDDFEHVVGFSANDNNAWHLVMFYFTTIIGLSFPYTLIMERYISRYEVKIAKLLTF